MYATLRAALRTVHDLLTGRYYLIGKTGRHRCHRKTIWDL